MKKGLSLFGALCLMIFLPIYHIRAAEIFAGDLIKASQSAVYYYGADGKRYVFPNEKTYKTWYADFSGVKTVTDAELAAIQIGGNATYKPGVKMVKITTDPKVYAVAKGGLLRWIKTEDAAIALYGANWAKKVEDVADAFFINYNIGADIAAASDFNVESETAAAESINFDKSLSAPVTKVPAPPAPSEPSYVWNVKDVAADGYLHKDLRLISYNSGFLAIWNDNRNGQNEIYFQKMGADGAAEGEAQRVSSNITDSTNGRAANGAGGLYVMWEDSSPLKRAVYLQKYDAAGNKLNTSLFASSSYATSENPDFAWNGELSQFGVVWWDTKTTLNGSVGDIYFMRMSNGLKTGAELNLTDGTVLETQPAVVGAGDKFAVVWQGGDNIIKFALADQDSAKYGTVKDVIAATSGANPKIAWSGSSFAVAWADFDGAYFILLDKNGNATDQKKLLDSGGSAPDIIWTGNKFYAAYAKNSDIFVAKMAVNGNVSDAGKNVSNTVSASSFPQLAKNGENINVSWLEDDGAVNKILAAVETK